jgi:GT2 family glycosyltransferase
VPLAPILRAREAGGKVSMASNADDVRVSVNVLARRGPEAVLACLGRLAAQLPAQVAVRLLDDGAVDGSAEAVARAFPGVEIVRMPWQHGFTGAHNRGLRRAFARGDDAVLVLSVDAQTEAGFLAPLLEVLKLRPRVAFVSPKIVLARDPGRIWYAGGILDWWRGLAVHRGAGTADDGRFDRLEPTDFATALCMLVRRQALDRAGPMDDLYADHLHDVDWSLRARRVGMEVYYQPRSRVLHEGPGAGIDDTWTPLGRPAGGEQARSRLRLVANHGRWYHWPTAAPLVAAGATQEAVLGWRRRDPGAPSGWRTVAPDSPDGPAGSPAPGPERRARSRPRRSASR